VRTAANAPPRSAQDKEPDLPPSAFTTLKDSLSAIRQTRFGIGNMAEKLTPDADGGLTIYIQHDSTGKDKEANWLPAPAEGFFMVMRMYQPEKRMYDGEYIVPPVVRK
jgi:hypothetical protein